MRYITGIILVFLFVWSVSLQAQEIHWMSFEEAIKAQEKLEKKIFVNIYTNWCGWCKRMDQTTFSNPTIADYINDKFYPVKFNAEQKDNISFKGNTYKHVQGKRRPYHELAAHLAKNRLSYPTIVFINEQGEVIQPIAGYQDAESFEMLMTFYGEDHYKEIPWGQYRSTFESQMN